MNESTAVNKEVTITAVYFRNRRELRSYPKRMEYNGNTVNFLESGLQYLIRRGQKMIQIFDMTDGQDTYRLKFDEERFNWTLVNRPLPQPPSLRKTFSSPSEKAASEEA